MRAIWRVSASLKAKLKLNAAMEAPALDRRFSVAPMVDQTDRHCRSMHRLLAGPAALLYTPMVHANAVIHGDRERLLGFTAAERPLALQLGGSDPEQLAEAARIADAQFGYSEVNLNVGCPSSRVQAGRFGACLMAEPELVARCVGAMRGAVTRAVITVKCRIGIDDQDAEADLERFVSTVAAAGCRTFIVHARKAWLKGLSPKENRERPPLDYGRVWRLKAAHPDLCIVVNGGITTLEAGLAQIRDHGMDGVMLGRAAYDTPWLLSRVNEVFYGGPPSDLTREAFLAAARAYIVRHVESGGRVHDVTRHVLGLYHGQPGARAFRRILTSMPKADQRSVAALDATLRAATPEQLQLRQQQQEGEDEAPSFAQPHDRVLA